MTQEIGQLVGLDEMSDLISALSNVSLVTCLPQAVRSVLAYAMCVPQMSHTNAGRSC